MKAEIKIEGEVVVLEAGQEVGESGGVLGGGGDAVVGDEEVEIAAGESGLGAAVGEMAGIAGDEGDAGVIAEDAAGFEDVDDGLGGAFLEVGEHGALPGRGGDLCGGCGGPFPGAGVYAGV